MQDSSSLERPFALADLDGDGNLDAAVLNQSFSNSIEILAGDGGEYFETAATLQVAGEYPNGIAVPDLNGDARPDLVISNWNTETVDIFLNEGSFAFGSPRSFAVGSPPAALAVGDLNGDDRLDLVMAVTNEEPLAILWGTPDGSFDREEYGLEETLGSIAIGDVTGDGIDDAVVGSTRSATLLVGGPSGVAAPIPFDQGTGGALALADLNQDGRLDIAYSGVETGVLFNQGQGTFSRRLLQYPGYDRAIAAGDVNEDGRLDLVVSSGKTLAAFLNLGNGSFSMAMKYADDASPLDASLFEMAVTDLDGDGRSDIVFSTSQGLEVRLAKALPCCGLMADSSRWRVVVGAETDRSEGCHVLEAETLSSFEISSVELPGAEGACEVAPAAAVPAAVFAPESSCSPTPMDSPGTGCSFDYGDGCEGWAGIRLLPRDAQPVDWSAPAVPALMQIVDRPVCLAIGKNCIDEYEVTLEKL